MLNKGDVVMYGTTGVCTVECIERKKLGKITKDYYVLKPVAQSASTVFIPTDSEPLLKKVRAVITKEELNELLESVAGCSDIWVDNDSQRRDEFGGIVSSGDRKSQMILMRTLRNKQVELSGNAKRLHISDEKFFKEVSRIVCDEISFVLNLSPKEAEELVYNK